MECECRRGRVITRQAITKVSGMQLLQIEGERRGLSSGEAWHETGAIYKADRTPGLPGRPPSLTSHPPRGDLLLAWTSAVPPGTALLARPIAHQPLPHHASLCRVHPPPALIPHTPSDCEKTFQDCQPETSGVRTLIRNRFH